MNSISSNNVKSLTLEDLFDLPENKHKTLSFGNDTGKWHISEGGHKLTRSNEQIVKSIQSSYFTDLLPNDHFIYFMETGHTFEIYYEHKSKKIILRCKDLPVNLVYTTLTWS